MQLARLSGFGTLAAFRAWGQAMPYRDTARAWQGGIPASACCARRTKSAKSRRDHAIIRLLFDLALRREEVVRLNRDDIDLQGERVSILGKKRTQKEWFSLPQPTASALGHWINMRGRGLGSVHQLRPPRAQRTLDRPQRARDRPKLRRAARLGVVRPHGLRHAAITAALDLTGGNVRAVQRFSRHRDLRTLTLDDDTA